MMRLVKTISPMRTATGVALYDFTSRYNYADRQIWQQIDAALQDLRASGLGLHVRHARGFDISPEMVRIARDNSAFQGEFHFEIGDLQLALPEQDASIDLTLCL